MPRSITYLSIIKSYSYETPMILVLNPLQKHVKLMAKINLFMSLVIDGRMLIMQVPACRNPYFKSGKPNHA
jgi:hypothetical protein